ncbi:hypothetical protein VNO80_24778 [Phaseolus coccineus]|uniref:Uncharacterized protein n=1 Tax=Phaseolus coccineus TaxID=3886 RepID=A0AAN9QSP3_PHACN
MSVKFKSGLPYNLPFFYVVSHILSIMHIHAPSLLFQQAIGALWDTAPLLVSSVTEPSFIAIKPQTRIALDSS